MAGKASPLDMAIDWMVLLRSGESTADDNARHRAWHGADPRHAEAWAQVSGAVQRSVTPLRDSGARQAPALQAALLRRPRRRVLRDVLALAGIGVATGWLVKEQVPVRALLADLRTGTGERRTLLLPDGSQLTMNARSAVDLAFSTGARVLRLREGEIIVSVSPDAARPFEVQGTHGSVRALGTRFLVRQREERTLAMVLEHSVRVRTRQGEERTLQAGESALFNDASIGATETGRSGLASWERGMLVADDQSLGEVVDALRPYRRDGFLRISDAAARLRVLGAFPLDQPERAIESLAQTLPIRVTRYGTWLVVIDTRAAPTR